MTDLISVSQREGLWWWMCHHPDHQLVAPVSMARRRGRARMPAGSESEAWRRGKSHARTHEVEVEEVVEMRAVEGELPCQRRPELFSAPDLESLWGEPRQETVADRDRRERAAVRLCSGCPAWRECREWAVGDVDQTHSVCGGLTPRELRVQRARGVAA